MKKISIIIVSYNTADLLLNCISSIKEEARGSYEIIVIDNDSRDDSPARIKSQHPDVLCIENSENVGFATACNQGLTAASGDYLVLLNPDTIVLDNALDRMCAYLESHPEYGLCAPANYSIDGHLQKTCHHFPTLLNRVAEYTQLRSLFPKNTFFGQANMSYWDYQGTRVVDWATGSCLMTRSRVIEEVGGLDPNYFLYVEETDWCLRAKKKGWPTVYYPAARIMHHSGASAKKTVGPEAMVSNSISSYMYQSQYYYYTKHKGVIYTWFVRAVDVAYATLLYTKNLVWSGKQDRSIKLAKYKTLMNLALKG